MSEPADDLFSVRGKTALVTGGARGVGMLIAQALVEAGAIVYLTSRDERAAERASAQLSLLGECYALPGEIATRDACRALAASFSSVRDRLHLLVHNAGVFQPSPLDDADDDDDGDDGTAWDTIFDVNVAAVFHLTSALLPVLEKSAAPGDPARVVNIGSVDGVHVPPAETYAYASSKAALHHLTRHLAKRLAPLVTVNAVALGPFESDMMGSELAEEIGARAPLGRSGGLDDIAGIVRFLGARASSYLTGVVLPVDGGIATTS